MKAHEALLMGCRMTEPHHGDFINSDGTGTCAMGAVIAGAYLENMAHTVARFPILASPFIDLCNPAAFPLWVLFSMMFEDHGYSRERCAEILKRIEYIDDALACEWFIADQRSRTGRSLQKRS